MRCLPGDEVWCVAKSCSRGCRVEVSSRLCPWRKVECGVEKSLCEAGDRVYYAMESMLLENADVSFMG